MFARSGVKPLNRPYLWVYLAGLLMPIFFVEVARLRDHLVLTSTLDDGNGLDAIRAEARRFLQQITETSQPRLSYPLLTAHLHVCVSQPVFAACVTDTAFEPQVAYRLLEEVLTAFRNEYGGAVESVEKEYVFIDFHTILDRIRAQYVRQADDANLGRVRSALTNVQESMGENIRKAVERNERLDEVGNMSEMLGKNAGMFAKQSRELNHMYLWRTYGRPAVIVGIVALVYILVGFIV